MGLHGAQRSALAAHLPRFSLTRVSTPAEFAHATALRQRLFRERRGVTFDERSEARRDRQGHVFLLFDDQTAVAVGRVLPRASALSALVGDSSRAADSEIGRVACVASRAFPACALLLLTLGSFWLLEHTALRRYTGYCHPKLLGSYRRLGAVPGAEIAVPGRSDLHRVISGSYEDAARFGSELLGFAQSARGTQP